MIRKIIKIEDEKCDGCGLCVNVCHEGAIAIIDGKAKLVRDDYCDGLGNCLPVCPAGAISFEEREAPPFMRRASSSDEAAGGNPADACDQIEEPACACVEIYNEVSAGAHRRWWPIQIKLVPLSAPFYNDADLLIAADCSAFVCKGFCQLFLKDKTVVIGCPKLDNIDYSGKLTKIIAANKIKSVTVIRMEVPCCSGIEHAAAAAVKASGKQLPLQVHILSIEGTLI